MAVNNILGFVYAARSGYLHPQLQKYTAMPLFGQMHAPRRSR
jgi:hypothetical protein